MVSDSLVYRHGTCRVPPKHVRDITVFYSKVNITHFLSDEENKSQ